MVLGQALAVFQAFSLAKLRNLRLLSQKLKFWESLSGMLRRKNSPQSRRRRRSKEKQGPESEPFFDFFDLAVKNSSKILQFPET
jgi:hypothetical protein